MAKLSENLPAIAPADEMGKAYHELITASENYRLRSDEASRAADQRWKAHNALKAAQEQFDKAVDKVRKLSPLADEWTKQGREVRQ